MLAGALFKRLMVLGFGLALATSAGAQQRQVLVLIEDGGGNAARPILNGLETHLKTAAVALSVESFDAGRFPDLEAETPTASYLRSKYSGRGIDALVAVGPQALTFLARNGAELFPGVPTVFAGVSEASVARANLPDSTGVISAFGVTETVDLALRLQPEAKNLVVITGTSALDTIWYGTAREQLSGLSSRIDVSHLAGLPLEDVLVEVAGLPRDAIVLFLSMVQDGSGRYFMPTADVVRDVAGVSSAPVYAVYETLFGTGVVGGAMASFQDTGADVGAMVLRILDGEAPAAIPAERQGNVYRTDWRQLQRFDLDASRLPPGTTVEFQPPPVWERYRQETLTVLGVLVFQTLLVVALLLRWRKRRVEHLLHESEDRYRNVVEAETDLICRYLPDTTSDLRQRRLLHLLRSHARRADRHQAQRAVARRRAQPKTRACRARRSPHRTSGAGCARSFAPTAAPAGCNGRLTRSKKTAARSPRFRASAATLRRCGWLRTKPWSAASRSPI